MNASIRYIDAELIDVKNPDDPEMKKLSMFASDTISVLYSLGLTKVHEIIYIEAIHYASEDQKREFIAWITSNNPDALIMTEAYASAEEYPESEYYLGEPELGKKPLPLTEILDYENKILADLGFVSVNNYICYEHKVAHVYNNEIGKKIKEEMDKLAEH